MSSGLSSLLVRDGVVSVKRMERAYQHQVIDGGSLDTILLEQGLVTEDKLAEYLELAAGLPAATWEDCDVVDGEAMRRCPRELAVAHAAAPLVIEDGALIVLVRDPVDLASLEALANKVGITIVPMVVPEYHWHLVFARDYGEEPEARFVELATTLGAPLGMEGIERRPALTAEEAAAVDAAAQAAAEAEPVAEAVAVAEPVAVAVAEAEPVAVAEAEPVAVAEAEPVAEPVAVAVAEPVAVSEPVPAAVSEPVAVAVSEPVPVAVSESVPVAVSEPVPVASSAANDAKPEAESVSKAWIAPEGWSVPAAASELDAESEHEPAIVVAPRLPEPEPTSELPPTDVASTLMPRTGVARATTQQLPAWRGELVPTVAAASEHARGQPRRPTRPGLATALPTAVTQPIIPVAVPAAIPAIPPVAPFAATDDDDDRPIGPATALQLLEAADTRDGVFHALLRALRSRTRWAGVLVVQGATAVGRFALADRGIDIASIATVSLPLDRPSPFHAVITARHPYVGQVTTGDPAIDDMAVRMGGIVPSAALLLPIVLRDRCVALAVAHRGAASLSLADVSELLPVGQAAAEALGRILVSRKHREPASPTPAPAMASPATSAPAPATAPPPASSASPGPGGDHVLAPRSPAASTLVPPVGGGVLGGGGIVASASPRSGAITATPPLIHAPALRPLAAVLTELDADDPDVAEAALVEATGRAEELLPLLPSRFPGTLKIDRYAVGGRTLRPGQYGPLLELLVRIGARATDLLIDLLSDADRDVRFYATVCLGGIRPRSALNALVERIFDTDYGVRTTAVEVLSTFSARDLDQAMVRARQALHSDDLERTAAAAQAVATLADVGALGDLVELVGKDPRRAEIARRALVTLTRHDLGTSARRWRSWYDEHRGMHRIEWLLAALGHRDQPLRESALEELRRLTGEDFGGLTDDGKKERESVRERWVAWWHKAGRRRFVA